MIQFSLSISSINSSKAMSYEKANHTHNGNEREKQKGEREKGKDETIAVKQAGSICSHKFLFFAAYTLKAKAL